MKICINLKKQRNHRDIANYRIFGAWVHYSCFGATLSFCFDDTVGTCVLQKERATTTSH